MTIFKNVDFFIGVGDHIQGDKGSGRTTKRGEGDGKGRLRKPEKNVITKLEGGGVVRALVVGPIKKNFFCGFPKAVFIKG